MSDNPATAPRARPLSRLLSQFGNRRAIGADLGAGTVLGVQSVPSGLATGLLAGVNPLYGLYAYTFGMVGGILTSSSIYMVVQATSAMAVVIADVGEVQNAVDPDRALFTLSMMIGLVMLVLGIFKLGSLVRFVPASVITGFITGTAINIVLGQLSDFTGYDGQGPGRIVRAIDTVLHIGQWQWTTVTVGLVTVALIVGLSKTRLGAMGMVVAVIVGTAMVPVLGWSSVPTVSDIASIPSSLPAPQMPDLAAVPSLLIPALSLTFVGLVQGAAISSSIPNPDGKFPEPSGDFRGQGVGNIAAGVFQGMPVGGSMSATAVNMSGGAKSRLAPIIAGGVMILGMIFFSELIAIVAMPVLSGVLIVVGFQIVKPAEIRAIWGTGKTSIVAMMVTFILTLIMPLQYAVLLGVGISIMLYVVRQSEQVRISRLVFDDQPWPIEADPPETVEPNELIVLMPYGSLFFAAAPVFEEALPDVMPTSNRSVVVISLHGKKDLGNTFMRILRRYNSRLVEQDCRLYLSGVGPRVFEQLVDTGALPEIGDANVYRDQERIGAALIEAVAEARKWISANDDSSSSQAAELAPDSDDEV
ncbi:MAG: SulP family inorganic anion transporter [Actinomycetia bacterium]|nr:SulP family inorganic anion transporter [Actinomycetes bacterium]